MTTSSISSVDPFEQTEWLRHHVQQSNAAALLARLGVSVAHEGHGLGAGLLADVISRTSQLGAEIGCRGPLVHSETIEARDFYLHLVAEFEPSPTDDLHLVLLMKDILKTL